RRWDQLGLIACLPLSLTALHLIAGSTVLAAPFQRYGAFLVVPAALALAFLTREILFTRPSDGVGESSAPRARPVAACVALGLAGLMLGVVRTHYFAPCESWATPVESVWTPWVESVSPIERAYAAVAANLANRSARDSRPIGVIADDWWLAKPFEFLVG